MNLTAIDIIFTVIIVLVGFSGFKKGFFSQIITIIGIFVGLFISYFYYDDLAPVLINIFGSHGFINILAFILLFVGVIIITLLINKIGKSTMENLGSEGVDKILGFIFGLVQGLFICIILTALLTIQPLFNPDKIFNGSTIGNKIITVLPKLGNLLPDSKIIDNSVMEKSI